MKILQILKSIFSKKNKVTNKLTKSDFEEMEIDKMKL